MENLNSQQQQAVDHEDGPMVVFAGAGSGKTRIITARIARLINRGVAPWEILAVTFTNKAAEEMKNRATAINPQAQSSVITTFHSACARWLREFGYELGFTPDYSIYDESDTNSLLKRLVKEAYPEGNQSALTSQFKSFIQYAKSLALSPDKVDSLEAQNPKSVPVGGITIYRRYQEALASSNAMDFMDLLLNMLLLLKNHNNVKQKLLQRFRYVLVDEFQDTNKTQLELVRRLTESNQNLFVVGDDDQSIYSWRGATPQNIIDFKVLYPAAKITTLELNYRCSKTITDTANALIQNNTVRAPKELIPTLPAGEKIDHVRESDGEMEAWWVVDKIKSETGQYELENTAIFYRTNSQSRALEELLNKEGIPYTIYGSIEFFQRSEVKDIISYLRVMLNARDEVSLRRIINVPSRGIGPKATEQIEHQAMAKDSSFFEAMRALAAENTRAAVKLQKVVSTLDNLRDQALSKDWATMVESIVTEVDYGTYLKKKYPDKYLEKLDNINELSASMQDYCQRHSDATLADWLQTVSLVRSENEQFRPGVAMMTLHMAKGLEFDRVYIVGLEEGLLPHGNNSIDPAFLEEERRLLYVGITRAKKKLSLLSAERRRQFNQYVANPVSRFLYELPRELLTLPQQSELSAMSFYSQDSTSTYENSYQYEDENTHLEIDRETEFVGCRVSHPTFGRGTIEAVDAPGIHEKPKLLIQFDDFGLRRIRSSQLKLLGQPE